MKNLLRSVVCSIALLTSTAFAGEIGSASINDVKLELEAADFLEYSSGVNPQGDEGSSGFDSAFDAYGDGAWEKIAKVTKVGNAYPLTYENSSFLGKLGFTFTLIDGKNGTWSVTNMDMLKDVTVDLVFAMHVGGGSGAWLFDDQFIAAGQTLQGTWVQNMVNGNNARITDFSNLTFFGRDLVPSDPIVQVPEPATLASLALGFGLMGLARRRKQQ
jgi:hypothetical protein